MTQQRIRIESTENVVSNAKILYLPSEGELFDDAGEPVTEVDISHCVQKVEIDLTVGAVSRATIHTILVDSRVEVGEAETIIRRLKRSRFWRLQRLTWRVSDWVKTRIARSLRPHVQRELVRRARQARHLS